MKSIKQILIESREQILYTRGTEFKVPQELKNKRWKTFNFGRTGKRTYDDLEEAVYDVLHKDCVPFDDVQSIIMKDGIVDVQYVFGKDSIGFSLKSY